MIELLRKIVRSIPAISKVLDNIPWIKGYKAQTFCDPINVKLPDNRDIVLFLQTNDNQIVFLDTYIDVSASDGNQLKTIEKDHDSGVIISSQFSGLSLPLAYSGRNCSVAVILSFCDNHILKYSQETNLTRFEIRGYFRVSRTYHGWTAVFQHTEMKAREGTVRST